MKLARSLQSLKPSYIREILAAAKAPHMISLAGGLPAEDTFPMHILAPIMTQLAQHPSLFQYGPTQGYEPLLAYCDQHFAYHPTHTSLITTGSQQGLDLIARAYLDAGDAIVMEAPSYLGALQVFELAQARILPVAQTSTGPDLTQLEAYFAKHSPKLFYAVPDFHNPTGVCWSHATREHVATLCQRYGVVLLEDAPYRELRFSGESLPMVSEFCPEQAVVLRSFSKYVSPGMRVGVITGPERFISPLITLKQAADLHSSVPMQALLLETLMHSDFPQHIQAIRTLYQVRYQVLIGALAEQLPHCAATPIDGGMFVWLTLPRCDVEQLAAHLLQQGVAVVPGSVFYPADVGAPPCCAVRLSFTHAEPDALVEGVSRIAAVMSGLELVS